MGPQGQTCKILQLSDCTMMYILSYLDATSLFNLSRTCSYFKNIVEDPQLWKYIEARRKPNTSKKVQYVCDRVHDKTAHLFLRAESKYEGQVLPSFLHAMHGLENLTILALENQRLDGRMLTLSEFPKSLEELSFKKTHVKNGKLFFQGSFHVMRSLKVLILDECDWVDSNFFLSIAKYEKLEILSIVKCMRLHLNVIPYLSVARHGCKNLKLIDCRFNTIGNEILRTFDSQKSLLALYFQSMSSYELDKGTPFMRCPPLTCEYHDLIAQSIIKNHSLDQFRYILGDLVEDIPHSILYTDPYPECSCGYKDRLNEGDFNINVAKEAFYSKKLKDIIKRNGVYQIVQNFTRITENIATILDLIITNEKSIKYQIYHTPKIADHSIITTELPSFQRVMSGVLPAKLKSTNDIVNHQIQIVTEKLNQHALIVEIEKISRWGNKKWWTPEIGYMRNFVK